MRTFILSAAALALTAGVAFANPGAQQLAAQAGVSANDYTQSQLIRLLDAQRDNDSNRIAHIMAEAGQNVSRSDMNTGSVSSDAQLAAVAGVAPGVYTTNELQRLIDSRRMNEGSNTNYIVSGESRTDSNPANVVTPGQAQLARTLGVNAADYSLAELTKLYADMMNDRS